MMGSDADPHVEGARGASGAIRGRVRNALIVGQVAIALVLLVASGLVLNSFVTAAATCRQGFSRNAC